MKLSELASLTGARCESSDGDIEITGAAGLEQAEPGQVTFLSNPRYTPKVAATGASAIYVAEDIEIPRADLAVLRAKDPYLAFTRALIAFHPQPQVEPAIHASAVIDETAKIG
ncbi:MAG TPA: LpxD N-terminal domain-containing protein, partial [Pyrinomonadaceae bacterium]